jgi:hypothetical protein
MYTATSVDTSPKTSHEHNNIQPNTIWKYDQSTYYVIITELFTGADQRNYVKYRNLHDSSISTMGVRTFKEWFKHVG